MFFTKYQHAFFHTYINLEYLEKPRVCAFDRKVWRQADGKSSNLLFLLIPNPCGHPLVVSFHSLLLFRSFTLFCLFSKYEVISLREPSDRPYDSSFLSRRLGTMESKELLMSVGSIAVISPLSKANFQSSISLGSVVSVLLYFLYTVKHGLSLLSNESVTCLLSSFSNTLSTALRTVIGL